VLWLEKYVIRRNLLKNKKKRLINFSFCAGKKRERKKIVELNHEKVEAEDFVSSGQIVVLTKENNVKN
jgi:hypothetical protein